MLKKNKGTELILNLSHSDLRLIFSLHPSKVLFCYAAS